MDAKIETHTVSEALQERAVDIIQQLLKRSLLMVHGDEREDRRKANVTEELNLTKAPLSWLYVLQIQSLISKETRTEALEGLESSVTSLTGLLDGDSRSASSSSQQTPSKPFLGVCREFGKGLVPTLSDLRRKVEEGATELEILISIKIVFELTISFYYKEKCCKLSAQKASQHLHQILISPQSTELAPLDPTSAEDQIYIPSINTVMQPCEKPDVQHGSNQNITADDSLVTVFNSHIVPMTPVIARKNSVFVRGTNPGNLQITQAAHAYDSQDGTCVIPCDFCLNGAYTPDNTNQMTTTTSGTDIQRYLTYVECCYPDGTMLSYLPIKHARLAYESNLNQRRPIMGTGTVTFAFLHVFLPNAVYQEIKQRAKNTYLLRHPNTQFVDHHETLNADGQMVKIEVLVKSKRTVRIQDKNRQLDYPVLQALSTCGHDICGPALMHMRFTSTKRGLQRIQLRIILFGVTVTRTQENYSDAIFDLLDCSARPIRTPLAPPTS